MERKEIPVYLEKLLVALEKLSSEHDIKIDITIYPSETSWVKVEDYETVLFEDGEIIRYYRPTGGPSGSLIEKWKSGLSYAEMKI